MISLSRLWALIQKELRQILRNRGLLISLLVPPTIQIIIFGFALNPTVNHLRLGVLDEARTVTSRSLISAFTENHTFDVREWITRYREVEDSIASSRLDAVLVIPADFERQRIAGRNPQIQILIDATNANTATIAQGYAALILSAWNEDNPLGTPVALESTTVPPNVSASVTLLYNPGLVTAWFIVTGTFGLLLILNGSLVASSSTIREKDSGTLEQLLMTPAETSEIIIAKIAPLFVLLMGDVGLILIVSRVVFAVPLRGSLTLVVSAGALCVLVGIGIGTFISSMSKSALQAFLLTFFVNPPLALLSGATTPVEAMPRWLQPLTNLNPIRHFAIIARSAMIKGSGMDVLWPHFLALIIFALVLVTFSVRRFRSQLA